jgi:hypothetical protein
MQGGNVMSGRVLLGVLLAGLAAFAWGALAHMVFGLGEGGMKNLPAESAVAQTMAAELKEKGIYMFPGMPEGAAQNDPAAVKAWEEAYARNPHGLIIYAPASGPLNMTPMMGVQLVTDILCALLIAVLMQMMLPAVGTYWRRVCLAAQVGLIAGCLVLLPYWNWYGFPMRFTIEGLAEQLVAGTVIGLVLGAFVKPAKAAVAAAA